jgi:hypothetical protein
MPADPALTPALVVIDTQSLFDWLVFRDPACSGWSAALGAEWKWIFTFEMRAEFEHVAAKGFGERWPVSMETCADAWTRHGRIMDVPAPLGAGRRLACSDPDDQKFIDLAIAAGAHTLVSRDKALLKLARRARERHGLRVCAPAAWSAGLVTPG